MSTTDTVRVWDPWMQPSDCARMVSTSSSVLHVPGGLPFSFSRIPGRSSSRRRQLRLPGMILPAGQADKEQHHACVAMGAL